jgi:TonB-linked SusC/RagA family outer membrane protein
VTVDGHPGLGAQADEQGAFRLAAPDGDVTLMARLIGYRRSQVVVPASQSSVDIRLEQDVLQLEGVVVTGAATTVSRKNVSTAVSVVNTEELTRAPSLSLESALQGKVTGATISLNSGAPGGGGQIQIRGVTSILGSGEPLIVLDGVIISNAAVQGGLTSITNATSSINSTQDNAANRLADLNPDDIASVEVLKGAASSAIYGSKATNGVVIITTKRGQSGKPQFRLSQRLGRNEPERLLHSRRFTSIDDAYEAALANGGDSATVLAACTPACPYFDYQKELYSNRALSYETELSISGGNEGTKYLVSGAHKSDEGTMINTGAQRQNIRVNLDQNFGSRWSSNLSTTFIHNSNARGVSNNTNNNTSPFWVFGYTPAIVDLNRRDSTGAFPMNPFAGGGARSSNPFQTMTYLTANSNVYRFIGGGRLSYSALTAQHHSVTLSAIGGIDWYNQDDRTYSPNFLQFEPNDGYAGTALQGNAVSRQMNGSLNTVWTYTPAKSGLLGFLNSATTSAGLQYELKDLNQYILRARGLIPGVTNINQGNRDQSQSKTKVYDEAYYGQEELLALDSRLLLSAGFRAERSSVNGNYRKLYVFPKASASYRFVSPVKGVDELKVRAAIGRSGNQPQYGFRYRTLTNLGQIGGRNSLGTSQTIGNPEIKPETMTEQEYGIDAALLGQRMSLEGTYFDRTITDLLLQAPLMPSTGLGQQIINGGKITSKGWELAVNASPLQTTNFTWTSRTSFYRVRQMVVSLPVPAFVVPNSGFGTGWGRSRISPGYSTTAIWGNIMHGDGTIKDTVVGDATPKFTMQFSNNFMWKSWSLNALLDWRNGGVMSNMTQTAFDEGKNSWDYDHPAPNGDPRPLGKYRYDSWQGGRNALAYVQDASFVKLREITLSYDVPDRLLRHLPNGVRDLRLSLSGRNLYTWTDYWGVDPEANNFGNQTVSRIVDLAPYPPTRSYLFSFSLGF